MWCSCIPVVCRHHACISVVFRHRILEGYTRRVVLASTSWGIFIPIFIYWLHILYSHQQWINALSSYSYQCSLLNSWIIADLTEKDFLCRTFTNTLNMHISLFLFDSFAYFWGLFFEFFTYSNFNPLLLRYLSRTFSYSVSYLIALLTVFFAEQKHFYFMQSHLSINDFIFLTVWRSFSDCLVKNLSLNVFPWQFWGIRSYTNLTGPFG